MQKSRGKYKNKHKGKAKKYKERENEEDSDPEGAILQIPLFMWDFHQCDPKKCSGVKLKRFRLIKDFSKKSSFKGIVLTPTATKQICIQDKDMVEQRGICVIDCSWNKFEELDLGKLRKSYARALPFLMAGNPINYGKAYKLSCAEAIAAALLLTGYKEEAQLIMSKFSWGHSFFDINAELLMKYSRCKDMEEQERVEEEYFKEAEGDEIERLKLRELMMNPPSSSSSDNENENENVSLQEDNNNLSPPNEQERNTFQEFDLHLQHHNNKNKQETEQEEEIKENNIHTYK